MGTDPKLERALVDRLSDYRTTAPVFRIVEQPVAVLERDAVEFGRRFAAASGEGVVRADLRRGRQTTTVTFSHGTSVKLFHASGAIMARRALPAAAHLFTQRPEKEALVSRSREVVRRLEVEKPARANERLAFERLWQIKAAGGQYKGERGSEILCRAVGAFRRFLHDLPVWGRASVFVKLAADDFVEAAGVDWRPCEERPFDEAPVIDPSEGAARVTAELAIEAGGAYVSAVQYAPDFFGLGYISLPKRRLQTVLQPVYVALLRPRGWTTLGRIVVVPATDRAYEPIGRPLAAPPRPINAKPTRS
jgi:hypothetical protein